MAGRLPWGKFFWNDWETDAELRLCSLAAQGLWMRLLCLAARAEPTGYVTVSGRAPSLADLSVLIGRPAEELAPLIDELDRNAVFSRDAKGRIYSRRMVRDVKKAAIARKNGKMGGNPSLSATRENPASDNPQDKAGDKAKSQKLEARETEREDSPPAGGPSSNGKYRWAGEVIRLTERDFNRWQDSFRAIDLPCQLASLDAYLASAEAGEHERKRWFQLVAGALKNRNEDALAKERSTPRLVSARPAGGYGAY